MNVGHGFGYAGVIGRNCLSFGGKPAANFGYFSLYIVYLHSLFQLSG